MEVVSTRSPGHSQRPEQRLHRMCISMITHPRSDETRSRAEALDLAHRPRGDPGLDPVDPTTMAAPTCRTSRTSAPTFSRWRWTRPRRKLFDRTRGKGVQSPHKWRNTGSAAGRPRYLRAGEVRRAHHRRHGRDRARRAAAGAADRRPRRPQPHVLLLSRAGFADGPSAGHAARPVRRVQLALPDRLPRRAGRADEVRRSRARGGLRPARRRAGRHHRCGLPFRTSGCPGKFAEDISACDRPYGDSPPSDIASYPFQPERKDIRRSASSWISRTAWCNNAVRAASAAIWRSDTTGGYSGQRPAGQRALRAGLPGRPCGLPSAARPHSGRRDSRPARSRLEWTPVHSTTVQTRARRLAL